MPESPEPRKRETDAGYEPLPIGTPGRPWPTPKHGEPNGLGVIQSDTDPLWLHSAREYAYVLPELLSNMPVPGMLEVFEAILHNPLVYVESDPAYGKTRTAIEIGNAMHAQGAVIHDAGSNGGNLESLLYATQFDADSSKDLVDRINNALRDGTLSEDSLALKALRELKVDDKPLLHEEGDKKVFDWNGLAHSDISRKEIDDVLSSVQKYQEWNGGLRIGFKDVEGALIKAAKEHRPLIIDELPRMKPGTENGLQRIWQTIAGAPGYEEITIPLGDLGDFTLHYGDIPKVIATGNKPKDGAGVSALPDSMRDRFVEKKVYSYSKEDWAHAISQDLTGVPITTLARLEKGRMRQVDANGDPEPDSVPEDKFKEKIWEVADKDKFRRNLESIRHANEVAVPPLQTKLLDHWQDVVAVSRALGRACSESAALLDPDSDVLKQQDMGRIRFEVDRPGDKPKKLTRRTINTLLIQAVSGNMPEKDSETQGADFTDWDMPRISPSKEPKEARLGERIKTLVKDWINETAGVSPDGQTINRPQLYQQLLNVWEEAGVIGADSVLDRLNIKNTEVEVTTDEVKQAHAVINNYLQAKYPGFEGVSVNQVELFLKGLRDVPPKFLGEEKVEAHVITSSSQHITVGAFTDAVAVASRTVDQSKPGGADFADFLKQHPATTLVDQDKAITTLALPYVSKELLQAISKAPDGASASASPAASYANDADVVMTTTIAKDSSNGTAAYAKLHVVHNKKTGKSLVVAFNKPTVKLGDDSSVTVVDAGRRGAKNQVKKWLDANVNGSSNELRAAFEERNAVPHDKTSKGLEALLTDATIKTFSPTMLDRNHSTSRSV